MIWRSHDLLGLEKWWYGLHTRWEGCANSFWTLTTHYNNSFRNTWTLQGSPLCFSHHPRSATSWYYFNRHNSIAQTWPLSFCLRPACFNHGEYLFAVQDTQPCYICSSISDNQSCCVDIPLPCHHWIPHTFPLSPHPFPPDSFVSDRRSRLTVYLTITASPPSQPLASQPKSYRKCIHFHPRSNVESFFWQALLAI